MEQTVHVSNYWDSKLVLLLAICNTTCGAYQQCTAPDTCTCVSGYTQSGTMCIRKYK